MSLVLWIIFGALVGWIASLIMDTNQRQGVVMDIILGVVGAFVGGTIMSFLGQSGFSGFNLYSFIVALLGAVVLIWVGRKITV